MKEYSIANVAFGAMNALGTLAFAFGGHNVVLEIQVRAVHYRYCPLPLNAMI